MESGPANYEAPSEFDLSEDFLTLEVFDFLDKLRSLKKSPALRISVDFSQMNEDEKELFIGRARRLKAFLDERSPGQKRAAKIKIRPEQKMWEPNVFASGVEADVL